jgi:hypothetical protein
MSTALPPTVQADTGAITQVNSRVDPYHARQLALQHAVATHASTVDEGQIVQAAEAYLAFLTGGKPADAGQ